MEKKPLTLPTDRLFDPQPEQRAIAVRLYQSIRSLPLISPHGHVEPGLFSDPAASFGSPADLFIIPDHYVFRMFYSQGIPLERLGIASRQKGKAKVEGNHRKIW